MLNMHENRLLIGSMPENWLLVGWACTNIGDSLAERTRKLVTHWLSGGWKLVTRWQSLFVSWLLASWAYAKIFLALHVYFQSFPTLSPVTHSSVPLSCPCLTSPLYHVFVVSLLKYVPCLTSLFLVLYPLSHVSVPCLPSAVPILMSLFLVSCPLSSVSRLCSLSLVLCTLSHVICSLSPILLSPSYNPYQLSQSPLFCGSNITCPLLFCFPSSVPPYLVLCPLSFILREI